MLIDTDILIDYLKGHADSIVFIESHIDQICISSVTVAELYQGVRNGAEKDVLDAFSSAIKVLEVNRTIGMHAGLLRRQYKASHNTGLADCLIAATAHAHQIPLRTLNVKHYPMLNDVEAPYSKH